MKHAGRIIIVGSQGGLATPFMGILANAAASDHTFQLRPLMALDDNIITAPASRIKKGKGPRDKWGKLL